MRQYHVGRVQELIDTCWDVNYVGRVPSVLMDSELIDTCWDVNIIRLPLNNRGLGN